VVKKLVGTDPDTAVTGLPNRLDSKFSNLENERKFLKILQDA
jgi:hypothetical protein